MRAIYPILCLFIFYLFIPAFSITPENIEIIKQGQIAMLNGNYRAAHEIISQLCPDDLSDPVRYIFRAAVLQAEMIDAEENLSGDKLKLLCDSTRQLAETKLKNCSSSDSALCYLYIGHQYAYRALWEARFGSKFSALKNGFKTRGQYRKGLEVDSTLYDLYLGLGSFHYWKSVKSGILRSIGIFKDERQKGIKEVQLAVDSSLFSCEAARSALIWIMLNENNYDSVIALSQTMFQKYPEGNSLLWPMAEAYFKKEQFDDAAMIYNLILNRLVNSPGNYFNIIESSYWLCLSFEKTEQLEKIKNAAAFINSIYDKIPKSTRKKQKSKLHYLTKQ